MSDSSERKQLDAILLKALLFETSFPGGSFFPPCCRRRDEFMVREKPAKSRFFYVGSPAGKAGKMPFFTCGDAVELPCFQPVLNRGRSWNDGPFGRMNLP
jgi:hypothetical protein